MTDKSIADVLDNTVNQLSNGVQTLSNAIQKVAPNAWKIAVHQQQLFGEQNIIIGTLGFILGSIATYFGIRFVYKNYNMIMEADHPGWFILVLCWVVIGISFMWFGFTSISDGYVHYYGAEYYAAKDILGIIKQ